MLQKQVALFSIINITVYQSLKSNLCSFHTEALLPSPVRLIMSTTLPVSDTNVISKWR